MLLPPPPDAHSDGNDDQYCGHCDYDDDPDGKARAAEVVTPPVGAVESGVALHETVEDVESCN